MRKELRSEIDQYTRIVDSDVDSLASCVKEIQTEKDKLLYYYELATTELEAKIKSLEKKITSLRETVVALEEEKEDIEYPA